MSRTHPLSIQPASTQPLTPAQKRFNGLVKKINRQRDTLAAWQEHEPSFARRWNAEYLPLQHTADHLQQQLALLLDHAADTIRLTQADQQTLHSIVCDIVEQLLTSATLDNAERGTLEALFDKHSPTSYAEQEQQKQAQIKAHVEQAFGVDLGDEAIDLDDPQALMRQLHAAMQAEAEHEATSSRPRKTSRTEQRREANRLKKQQEQELAEKQASQSVQSIFRRLASSLHPDRETDPAQRERKTALMQRATTAYKDNRLLDLLQLQLEVEQIQPGNLAQLANDQLKHYNRVLHQQSEDLTIELLQTEAAFRMRYSLDPDASIQPSDMPRIVNESVALLEEDNHETQQMIERLQESKALKRWLNQTRKNQQFDEQMFDLLQDLFPGGMRG